jgi:hypothetical protein
MLITLKQSMWRQLSYNDITHKTIAQKKTKKDNIVIVEMADDYDMSLFPKEIEFEIIDDIPLSFEQRLVSGKYGKHHNLKTIKRIKDDLNLLDDDEKALCIDAATVRMLSDSKRINSDIENIKKDLKENSDKLKAKGN